MKLQKDALFLASLDNILDYIAQDGLVYAKKFNRKLQKALNSIPNFPYKSRKSLYYDSEDIRDYIFKGYTIPYFIDNNNNKIILLDIFKWIDK